MQTLKRVSWYDFYVDMSVKMSKKCIWSFETLSAFFSIRLFGTYLVHARSSSIIANKMITKYSTTHHDCTQATSSSFMFHRQVSNSSQGIISHLQVYLSAATTGETITSTGESVTGADVRGSGLRCHQQCTNRQYVIYLGMNDKCREELCVTR